MHEKLDDKDFAILDVLKRHGDYTVRQIAKKTALAPATVHSRLKRLRSSGVIKRFTVELDQDKLGMALGAYIMISADLKMLKEKRRTQYDLYEEVKRLPGVQEVHIVTGGTDVIAKVRVRGMEEFDDLLMEHIQLLEGVSKTQTMMIMH
jgi:Lrp/AsnC family transcriptional regulator for asnA, asnC and gidA